MNKWVFKCFLKLAIDAESFTQDVKLFHKLGPAAGLIYLYLAQPVDSQMRSEESEVAGHGPTAHSSIPDHCCTNTDTPAVEV